MNFGFTLDPCGTVRDAIDSWGPRIFESEEQYEESLEKKLKKSLKNQKIERQYAFNGQRADVVIQDKVPIELKNHIRTDQEVNNTISQLKEYLKKWRCVFLVICGDVSDDRLKMLEKYAKKKEHQFDFFDDIGVKIIKIR